MKAYDATIQIKTLQQYFHMVLSIFLGFYKKKLFEGFVIQFSYGHCCRTKRVKDSK